MTGAAMKQIPILLVEDDAIDIQIVKRTLKKESMTNPLFCAYDGVEALEVLNGTNGKTEVPQPCLILLDINMPRMNGLELLQKIRNSESLKQNIAIVLTTSNRNEDKVAAYNLSAAGYILKENIEALVQLLERYCRINELPLPQEC